MARLTHHKPVVKHRILRCRNTAICGLTEPRRADWDYRIETIRDETKSALASVSKLRGESPSPPAVFRSRLVCPYCRTLRRLWRKRSKATRKSLGGLNRPHWQLQTLQLGLREIARCGYQRRCLPALTPLPQRGPPKAYASHWQPFEQYCRIEFSKITTFSR